jgi:hypothetical protein
MRGYKPIVVARNQKKLHVAKFFKRLEELRPF